VSIEAEKNKLFGILNIYSDCEHCGVVLSDPNLLKPDPYNPGRFKSLCPACKMETWRSPLVYSSLKEVFEMIAQCAEIGRPILVLTLACTAYEMMVDDFAYRLLEKENSSLDVCSFVVDSLELRGKIKLIESMTSKKIKDHAKDLGFDSLSTTYEKTKQKRKVAGDVGSEATCGGWVWLGRFSDSDRLYLKLCELDSLPGADALPRAFNTRQEARVMLQPIIKTIVF
jgi:hypothetical protein